MNRRTIGLSCLALASAAGAQAPSTTGSTVTYSLTATDIPNTNGYMELGESVILKLTVSFSGQNTTASYTPPSPAPGSGTIRGFGSGFIDINGTATSGGNANGAWNTDYINPGFGPIADGWDLVGPFGWGTPASGGSNLLNIQFGQFPVSASQINTTNPVNLIWQALWTPNSYTPRTVTFAITPALASGGFASSVMFQTSPTGIAGVNCASTLGSVNVIFPIPAPATSLILAAPLLAARRRRTTPP